MTIDVTLKPVTLVWRDASFDGNKFTQKQIDELEPITVHTTGYIVRRDDKLTVLAQTYFKYVNKYENLMLIPSSLIIEISPKDSDKK